MDTGSGSEAKTFQKQTGGQENVQGLGSVQCGFSIGRGDEMAEMFFGTERFQDMENGEPLGCGKRARLYKSTYRDILQYWDENGKVDGGISPTSELPSLTKWWPGKSGVMPGILLAWPQKWWENAKEKAVDLA